MKIECYPLHDSAIEAARVLNRKALIFGMNKGYGILDTHDKTDWLRAEIAKYECGNLLAIRWR